MTLSASHRKKQEQLDKITQQIIVCPVCKQDKIGKAVPGEGNPNADIIFLGEAPGRQESISGRPFIGRSGQLLRSLIREVGLSESDVYITSPVKYLPIRGTPSQKDIDHGRVHLQKQLGVIEPKIIVLLGSTAVKAVLGEPRKILQDHGSIIPYQNWKCLMTLHPAAVLRFPKYKPLIVRDFALLKTLI